MKCSAKSGQHKLCSAVDTYLALNQQYILMGSGPLVMATRDSHGFVAISQGNNRIPRVVLLQVMGTRDSGGLVARTLINNRLSGPFDQIGP